MADRVVKVTLRAVVDDYKKGMREAAEETRTVGTQAEKLQQVRQSLQVVGTAGLAMGAALSAGIGLAVSKFAEFDQAMSFVAATGDDARENMDALRQSALDAGASTVFSATEAANAIEEMAKAGLSAKAILGGGLNGALDLAAAGGLEVADAAGIAATALKTFNLQGSDMSHVADLLAAGAGKAMGDVSDLSAALNQTALVANSTGLSIEETTAGLAAFASQGLLGSDAGTSFKTMLGALTPNSAKAADEMNRLGISAYDASGNFVGLEAFAGQLRTQMAGLTDEQRNASLEIMFGSDAVRAATVLYSEGESGIRDWIKAVDDQGYAAETAATRLDNLKGDWEGFQGALDSAFISMGEGANGPLRMLVQGLTDLVDSFTDLPEWAQQATLWVGAVTAAVSLGGGAFLTAIPRIAEYNAAIATMGPTAQRASSLVTGALKAAGAAALFLAITKGAEMTAGALGQLGDGAKSANETMALLLDRDYDGIFKGMTKGADGVNDLSSAFDKLLASDPGTAFNRWGSDVFAFTGLQSTVGDAREQFTLMGEALAQLVNQGEADRAAELFKEVAAAAEEQGYSVEQVKDLLGPYQDALTGVSNQNDLAADAAKTSADTYLEQADAVESLRSQFMDLIEAIDEANGKNRDAVSANIDYQDTLRDVGEQIANITAGVEGFGRGFDITTAAGANNKQMLVDLSQSAWDAAAAQLALDGDTAAFTSTLEAQRQRLYDAAIQMGASEEEAATLRDTLLAMPDAKTIQVLAETQDATSKLTRFQQAIDNLRGKTVEVTTKMTTVNGKSVVDFSNAAGGIYSNGVKAFAAGGFEPGIYPYTPGGIHKFAEEYDEAFLSLDPRRRERSYGVWQEVGDRFGFSQTQQAPQLSLDGMSITGTLDLGNGLTGFVDGRIRQNSSAVVSAIRGRRRSDA